MHCVAGLDTLTSGHAFIGDVDLSTLKETELTKLRRDRVGFVFQAFNLVPTLTEIENITLPSSLAGRHADQAFVDSWSTPSACGLDCPIDPPNCPAASSNASPLHGHWSVGRTSSSLTNRPGTSIADRARRS